MLNWASALAKEIGYGQLRAIRLAVTSSVSQLGCGGRVFELQARRLHDPTTGQAPFGRKEKLHIFLSRDIFCLDPAAGARELRNGLAAIFVELAEETLTVDAIQLAAEHSTEGQTEAGTHPPPPLQPPHRAFH